MKHKLFLCILFLVLLGLYCENCVESFTQKEKDKIKKICQTMLTNQIKSINVGDTQNKMNVIKEELKKELIDSGKCIGPQGPKGDTGGKTNVYQGLYSLDDPSKPFASIGKDINNDNNQNRIETNGYSTRTPTNNIIQLNPRNQSQFILTNKDRWQYTEENTLVSGYNPKFTMCYNANGTGNIYNCHDTIMKNNNNYANEFKYDGKTQQFFISEDKKKCIEKNEEGKLIIATDCDTRDINNNPKKTQQFFLH